MNLWPLSVIDVERVKLMLNKLIHILFVALLQMMLYGAMFGCLSPVLSISAILSHKSPFVYSKDEVSACENN